MALFSVEISYPNPNPDQKWKIKMNAQIYVLCNSAERVIELVKDEYKNPTFHVIRKLSGPSKTILVDPDERI